MLETQPALLYDFKHDPDRDSAGDLLHLVLVDAGRENGQSRLDVPVVLHSLREPYTLALFRIFRVAYRAGIKALQEAVWGAGTPDRG